MFVTTGCAFGARKGQDATPCIDYHRLLLGRRADIQVGVVVAEGGVPVEGNYVLVEVRPWGLRRSDGCDGY